MAKRVSGRRNSHLAGGRAVATEAVVPMHVGEFGGRVEGGFCGTTPGGKEGTVADKVRDTVSPE